MTELANWVASGMPGNYNGLSGYGLQSLRPAARPARGDRRRPAGARHRRFELGHRHGGQLLGGQRRHRNLGVDPVPVESEHAGRDQADRRPHQPLRHHPDHRRPGHRGPDGADGAPTPRSCSARWRARRRIRTMRPPRAARRRRARTTPRSSARRPQRRAHRHSARVLLRRTRRRPATREPRGGLNPDQSKVDGRGDRRPASSGRRRRRSRRHPQRGRRPMPTNNFLLWSVCAGADGAKGKDANCSIVFKYGMKRDFNAWLAVARRRRAGQDAHRAARVEHGPRRRAARSSTGSRSLDISDEMDLERDAARYEADRAKDSALSATHGIDEVMKAHELDALLFPGASGAAIAAKPGYPDRDRAVRLRAERAHAGRSRRVQRRRRRPSASASPAWRAASRG